MKRVGAYYKLFYHFTWATRNRLPLITSNVESVLLRYLRNKCLEFGYKLLALNCTEDHVHLLLELTPTIVLADVAKKLKGSSAHFINKESGQGETLYWQDGYGVLTLREGDVPGVAIYIKNQKHHHQTGKLSEHLEIAGE
jgi:putative transposase